MTTDRELLLLAGQDPAASLYSRLSLLAVSLGPVEELDERGRVCITSMSTIGWPQNSGDVVAFRLPLMA